MNWLITLLAGMVGLVLGIVGLFAIANQCVKWYRISSFEGGSGYFVVGLSLMGGLGGFLLAVIAGRLAYAWLGTEWYLQVVIAIMAVIVALIFVWAFAYAGVDRVPSRHGERIEVEWEIRLPAVEATDQWWPRGNPRDWPDDELRLELVSVVRHRPRGSQQAVFDRSAFRSEDNQWIVVARVPLFTSKGEFCVNLTLGGRDDGFWPAMRSPTATDSFQWSPWVRTNKAATKPDDLHAMMYRFRYALGNQPGVKLL